MPHALCAMTVLRGNFRPSFSSLTRSAEHRPEALKFGKAHASITTGCRTSSARKPPSGVPLDQEITALKGIISS